MHVFSYVTKGTDCHHNSLSVEKSAELLLEHLTKDSEIMSKQHSVETHSLRSCEPGTFHIVWQTMTNYVILTNSFLQCR